MIILLSDLILKYKSIINDFILMSFKIGYKSIFQQEH